MRAPPTLVSLIQARTSSARLPGKVLLPLGDTTVLGQVCRRAAALGGPVVVCTSSAGSDDPIAAHCAELGVHCHRGPLDDVFARFRGALADPRVSASVWLARITADCPLLSVPLARQVLAATSDDLDYVGVDVAQVPRGLSLELVRRATFAAIDERTLDGPQREHVTLALYEDPARYRCLWLAPPPALRHPEPRLTLDYPEDYELLRRLFAADPDVSAEAAVARLIDDPALRALNAACDQRGARA